MQYYYGLFHFDHESNAIFMIWFTVNIQFFISSGHIFGQIWVIFEQVWLEFGSPFYSDLKHNF